MKTLVLVPFHEDAYMKLSDYLRRSPYKAYLPLPRSFCMGSSRGLEDLGYTPSSLLRVWKPLLELMENGLLVNYECYLKDDTIQQMVNTATKVALLVLKARAYGKADLGEWLTLVPETVEPSITSWSGVCVVDRFLDYYIMMKKGVEVNRVQRIEVFAPTPLELFTLVAKGLVKWKCSLEEVVWWVVKYLGDFVIPSPSLTSAYRKLAYSDDYIAFIEKCAPEEDLLHYWM
ncbi:MAG: hypothetical protein QXI85_04745 [Desulfurococcaceae archaeon]